MSESIVLALVKKDFHMVRKTIINFSLISILCIAAIVLMFGKVPNWVFVNLAFTLLIAPPFTCAIVILMRTNVLEKEKSTQVFIMTLPVTVKEFTTGKILVNIPLFFISWVMICAIAFYFSFGLNIFPQGTIPLITMIFLGVLLAYIATFSVSLTSQSLGITVLFMCLFELGTPVYLWIIAFLEPINSHLHAPQAVWNATALSIVALQILSVAFILWNTWKIQTKKIDFI